MKTSSLFTILLLILFQTPSAFSQTKTGMHGMKKQDKTMSRAKIMTESGMKQSGKMMKSAGKMHDKKMTSVKMEKTKSDEMKKSMNRDKMKNSSEMTDMRKKSSTRMMKKTEKKNN